MNKYLWLLLVSFCVGFLIQGVHELGHVVVMSIQGHNPTFTFSSLAQSWHGDARPVSLVGWTEITSPFDAQDVGYVRADSYYRTSSEAVVSLLAGPIAGIIFAGSGLVLAYRSTGARKRYVGLVAAFCSSLFMIFYYFRSPGRIGGDEGFAAAYAGISKYMFIIPLGLCFLLILLLSYSYIKMNQFNRKDIVAILGGFAASGAVLTIVNSLIVYPQIFAGNPLFNSFYGFSLPVFLTYGVAALSTVLLLTTPADVSAPKAQ